jgi:hypothetical protein
MHDRTLKSASTDSLWKLLGILQLVQKELTPGHGSLTLGLLGQVVKGELFERAWYRDNPMNTDDNGGLECPTGRRLKDLKG